MKTTSKLLAMLLIVVMSMSLFGGLSAFADSFTVTATQTNETPVEGGTVNYQLSANPASCYDKISVVYVAWDCGDSPIKADSFYFDGTILSVPGGNWSPVLNVIIGVAGGDDYMVVPVGIGESASCSVEYTPEPDPVVFEVTQKAAPNSFAYSFDSSKDLSDRFEYVVRGAAGNVEVYIDGVYIRNFCNFDSNTGILVIPATAVLNGSNQATHYLTFVNGEGQENTQFTIVDTRKYTSEDPYNNGKQQTPTVEYLQGSDTIVRFNTAEPTRVEIYDRTAGDYVSITPDVDYTYSTTVYGTGITFMKEFLNDTYRIKAGRTYEIWCVYGNGAGQGVQVGFLKVGNRSASDPRYEGRLYFTNGNVSTTETKWVSGSIKPEMFCDLFLIDGAYLQVSSNGGQSWRDVGINDYLIKNDSSDHRTAYAYFGDKYLNSLAGDSMYYYRVYVPAGKIDTTEVHSNAIIITTGATLSYIDTDKHVINSTKNLRFKSSAPIDKVYVGNIELTDPNYFSLSNDKKTVTLSPEFLNSRTAGNTYTLSVLTKDGEKLSTTFQILTTGQASSSPRTGDESQIALWAAFVLVSGAAVAVVAPKLRKNED